tara:strand:+ start:36440 stop:37600 length:1161 start_codon:yes stop_codon:yes gene_type:complete
VNRNEFNQWYCKRYGQAPTSDTAERVFDAIQALSLAHSSTFNDEYLTLVATLDEVAQPWMRDDGEGGFKAVIRRMAACAQKEMQTERSTQAKTLQLESHDLHALERQIEALDIQCNELMKQEDYSAEFPGADAESLRRILDLLKNWQPEGQPPAVPDERPLECHQCEDRRATEAGIQAVANQLREALKGLTFAARISGGTAGPDKGLKDACDRAEKALSLGGIAGTFIRAAGYPPQPLTVPDAIAEFIAKKKSELEQYADAYCHLEPDTNAAVWDSEYHQQHEEDISEFIAELESVIAEAQQGGEVSENKEPKATPHFLPGRGKSSGSQKVGIVHLVKALKGNGDNFNQALCGKAPHGKSLGWITAGNREPTCQSCIMGAQQGDEK